MPTVTEKLVNLNTSAKDFKQQAMALVEEGADIRAKIYGGSSFLSMPLLHILVMKK